MAAVEEALGMRVIKKEVAKYSTGDRQRGWIQKGNSKRRHKGL